MFLDEKTALEIWLNPKLNLAIVPRTGHGFSVVPEGGVLPYIRHIGMSKGMVFTPFWSENGYRLCSFWSGIECGFQGNYGSVGTYLLFQFQMSNKEREICEFEMRFKKSFLLLF